MPKICIDARFWGIKHTGIGRYVENLIANLPADPSVEVVLIVRPDQANEPKLARFKKHVARFHPYSVWSQLEMLWLLLRIRPNLLHVPHFTVPVLWPGRMVVTIHDLIKHASRGPRTTTRPTLVYWLKYLGYRLVVWLALHRVAHILVPSKYWQDELANKYGLSRSKISVTYEGVSNVFLKGHSLKDYPFVAGGPFVVYTGNLYPHKNVLILIAACERLKINLAIVCARDVFASRLPKSKYVYFLGRLTDEELVALYHQAEAFTFPSLIEGFGLPGLEAMAVGLPVVCSDIPVLHEVYGEAALYFDPHDAVDLVDKIERLMEDNHLRQSLIAKGRKQVSKYSWSKMAKQTWQIYCQVLDT